jgi:hypothetical protein
MSATRSRHLDELRYEAGRQDLRELLSALRAAQVKCEDELGAAQRAVNPRSDAGRPHLRLVDAPPVIGLLATTLKDEGRRQ